MKINLHPLDNEWYWFDEAPSFKSYCVGWSKTSCPCPFVGHCIGTLGLGSRQARYFVIDLTNKQNNELRSYFIRINKYR